ncbi:competence type IV pilus major pilin ComGC [Bacillaceae bacterium W0354]
MYKNNSGFTLIEMLIVLLVISVLLLITIPNVTKHNSVINDKGCEAYIEVVQAQVELYKLDHQGKEPTSLSQLVDEYIPRDTCPDEQTKLVLNEGRVVKSNEINTGE